MRKRFSIISRYMKTDIPFYILRLLDSGEKVPVNGLGVFSLKSISSYISASEKKIYPPGRNGDFLAGGAESKLLATYMADKSGISLEESERLIAEFVSNVKERTRAETSLEIEQFGRFWINPNGDIAFTPNAKAFNQRFVYFKELDLAPAEMLPPDQPTSEEKDPVTSVTSPIPEVEVHTEPIHAPHKDEVSAQPAFKPIPEPDRAPEVADSVRKRNLAFLGVVLVLILLALTLMLVCSDRETGGEKPEVVGSIVVDEETGESEDPPEQGSIEQPEEPDPVLDEGAGDPLTPTETETEPEDPATEDPVQEQEPREAVMDTQDLTPDDWECMVVAGAFSKAANRDRMIARLGNIGYVVKTWSENGITRVGVPVQCDSEMWLDVLTRVRQEIDSSAWLYKKEGN